MLDCIVKLRYMYIRLKTERKKEFTLPELNMHLPKVINSLFV